MEQSSFGRLLSVLVSPGRTFEVLRERPTWVWALVVFLVAFAVIMTVVVQKTDSDAQSKAMYDQLAKQGIQGSEADQRVEQFASISEEYWWVGLLVYLFGVVFWLLFVVVYLFIGLRFVGGSSIGFRQTLATTLHGLMPQVVGMLLSLPILLAGGLIDPQAAQRGEVGLITNPGRLAPEDASLVVTTLLSSLDIVTFWTLFLLVLGLSIVGRVSKGLAATVALSGWLLWVVVKIGLAALGQSFGG